MQSRTIKQRVGHGAVLTVGLCMFGLAWMFFTPPQIFAATGINQQLNYQARLLDNTGAIVPDGSYNIEFKIYQDGNGVLGGGDETLKWTETRTGGNKVTVKNGYFSVQLGSVNAFGNSVDWSQDTLWLSTNIGGTGSPTWDGEMNPFRRLASSAYSFNSNRLGGLTAAEFLQLAPGSAQTDNTNNNSLFVNKTSGTGNILQLQKSGVDVLNISNNGLATFSNGISVASDTITDFTGNGLVVSSNTLNVRLDTTPADGSSASSASGLEFVSGELSLIRGCAAGGILEWDNSNFEWDCGQDDTSVGGGGTLAQAYDTGSAGNQVITLDGTQDSIVITNPSASGTDSGFAFQINQNNTTAGVMVADFLQASNASNAVNITANAIDSETGLAVTANALTSGKVLSLASSSTAFTGALAEITASGSNAANTGSLLKLNNTGAASASTGLYIDHRATGAGNYAFRIDDVASDNTPFIVDGDGRAGIGTTSITGTTERLLQVGSETNRGNAAVYGELVSKGLRDLTTIANIRDIYVYDTTADTDGGRWVDWATTDKMSWYNEVLDDSPSDPCDIATDDRCYSKNFPRRAILVVTTDALYIFDGQNNTMWMKFGQNAAGWGLGVDTNNNPSSVTALNGVIYVGTNGSTAGGLYTIDFTGDRMWNYDDTDRSGADVGIASRNSAVTYNSDNNTNFDLGGNTGWKTVNDVSAVAMNSSNTAIAATTGPNNGSVFVGLATDSGVNLINLSHQRLFQYSRITDDDYSSVVVSRTGKLYALDSTRDELDSWINVDSDQASQVNAAADKAWDETTAPALTKSAPQMIAPGPDALEVVERGSLADSGITAGASSDLIYVGTDQGLTELHDHATITMGWTKYYNTTRQTALMPATIRRAHMMDDASGNVTNQSLRTSIMSAKGTPTYGVQGVRGKAMTFNGTSQYLCSDANADATCDNDTTDNMNTGSWTVSAWFKHPTAISGTDVLFARCYNTTPAAAAGCVAASMTSTGTMAVNVDYDATFTIGVTGTTVFHNSTQFYNDNQWHHIIITRAATTGNINTMIDGKPMGQTAGLNTTLDAAQIWGIGTDCSTGAACATGGNFWDGQIDDFVFNANGSTGATDVIPTTSMRRIYNDSRPLVNKKVINVTDATSATTSTITDSGEAWIPQEFAGQIVTITGGTGAGQTRHIVSNTATSLTVSPAFSTTPDTTTDFEVDPEALYGATNNVKAIGITAETPLGEARQMCVGTNDGADGGGVTCYNHNAGPNVIADVYHGDSEQFDDSNAEWTGTDYDDIQSIDLSGRALVIGSEAQLWTETEDVRLGQGLDYLANKLFDVRAEILNDGISTAGSLGMEVGMTGGADLAEHYTSSELLLPGEIVSLEANNVGAVKKSSAPYQKDIIGIVATDPGLILGQQNERSYPIALVGRVPVKVTTENGAIQAGDRLTSSSTPGYAMKATHAGRVLGTVLDDMLIDPSAPCPDQNTQFTCGSVTVFVNLVDYNGSIELAISDAESSGLLSAETILDPNGGLIAGNLSDEQRAAKVAQLSKADKILRYLSGRQAQNQATSEVLADRISSVDIHGANIFAKNIVTLDFSTGGLTIDGNAHFNGNAFFSKDIALNGHVTSGGTTPNLQTQTSPNTSGIIEGNDSAGQINVSFANEPTAGSLFTATFNKAYGKAPRVFLSPTNNAASQLKYFVSSTPDGFSVTASDPALTNTMASFNYWVIE